VDNSKAYTKPWTVMLRQQLGADTELTDEICAENEKSSQHLRQRNKDVVRRSLAARCFLLAFSAISRKMAPFSA
jgi:hypothetical protein